jgi:phosphate starvation-inducible PhoH-like protein
VKRPTRSRNTRDQRQEDPFPERIERPRPRVTTLTAKNPRQKLYLKLIESQELVFGLGPAGTGKTFLAAWKAAEAFEKGLTERIIVTRPAIEAGEALGFLPGEMEEKIDPYFAPVREALEYRLGKGALAYMLKRGQCRFVPLAFMRGTTFRDSWVLADEMQNSTPRQMKMLLSRAGEGSRVIVNGDLRQSDIPGPNGLADAISRLRDIPRIGFCTFLREDVVRSGLARLIVDAYEGTVDEDPFAS